MKKTIILIAIVGLIPLAQVNAQISKGSFLVGVSSVGRLTGSNGITSDLFGIGSTTIKADEGESTYDTKLTSISIMPKTGYFILDNLALGLDGCLISMIEKSEDHKYSTTLKGIGPFARYYFKGSKVMPVVEAGALFGSIKNKSHSDSWDETSKDKLNSLWGGAGFSARLGTKATFDLLAGYNKAKVNFDSDGPDPSNTRLGTLSLKAGFTMLLGSGNE